MEDRSAKNIWFHKAPGTDPIDIFHSDAHENIEKRARSFKSSGGGTKVARGIVEDAASQLKVSADLTGGDGDKHLDEVKKELNQNLPEGQKFVLSNDTTK